MNDEYVAFIRYRVNLLYCTMEQIGFGDCHSPIRYIFENTVMG